MKDKINSLILQLNEEKVFESDDGFCNIEAQKIDRIIKILEESKEEIERLEYYLNSIPPT